MVPNVLGQGDNAKIIYKGLLSKSGANHVYAHVGYGNQWNNLSDIKMSKTSEGFEAELPIISHDRLNVVFKDCANNWDNNSGWNYSFEIQTR